MRIGIIGAGAIGGTLAALLVRAGHEVGIANAHGPESLAGLVRLLGPRARALTAADAARFGHIVVVSIPFGRIEELPARELDGKLVIDTNNYYPERDGVFPELEADESTSSELLQHLIPGARVVKALNMLRAPWLSQDARPSGDVDRLAVAISGDDPDAKARVATLIDQIGFDAFDAGDLARGGRLHQRGGPLYTRRLTAGQIKDLLLSFSAHGTGEERVPR